MTRRWLARGLGLLLAAPWAQAQWLVSPEDMRASALAPEPLHIKSTPRPDAPAIELLRPARPPSPGQALVLNNPMAIELRFQAAPGSQILPETFRVLYGRLRLDITARLLSATRVSAEGLSVREAQLPAGQHRIVLGIEDNQGRAGQTQLEFEIR